MGDKGGVGDWFGWFGARFGWVRFGWARLGWVIGSVDMKSAFALALLPQPPMGSQARDPLGAPALAHASLVHCVDSLTYRFG